MSADFLTAMARSSRERVAHERQRCALPELQARVRALPAAPPLALSPCWLMMIVYAEMLPSHENV